MRSILAWDIGASQVACGRFARGRGGRLRLLRYARVDRAAEVADEGGESETLRGVLERVGGGAEAAVLGLPGHLALAKFVRMPAVARGLRDRVLQFEAAQHLPYALEEVVWAHRVIAEDASDLEVVLTAARVEVLDAVCDAAAAAGVRVEATLPAGLALREAFRQSGAQAEPVVVVVEVGARSTHVLLLGPRSFGGRTLALGGASVTREIATELSLEWAAAETLKRAVCDGRSALPEDAPERVAVRRAAEAFAARLQGEIARSVAQVRRQSGGEAATRLYLTGGGALIPSLPATLAAGLALPVERWTALQGVEVATAASGAADDEARLADLVGLATRLLRPEAGEGSLLPVTLARAVARRRRQPWWLAAAMLAVLAAVPPLVYYHRLARETEAAVARVERQLGPVRVLQTRMAADREQIEQARRELAAWRGLVEAKSWWSGFLADLQGRLGQIEDVWLDRMEVVHAAAEPGETATRGAANGAGGGAPRRRLALSGRLLDPRPLGTTVSADAVARVQRLLASLAESPWIAAVEDERFETVHPGLLRFDVTVVLPPTNRGEDARP